MDNEQKNTNLPKNDDNWLDNILGTAGTAQELGPDELAVQAAGLTHPNDVELEKILSEDWDSVPDLDPQGSAAEGQDTDPLGGESAAQQAGAAQPDPTAQEDPSAATLPEQGAGAAKEAVEPQDPPQKVQVSDDTVYFTPAEVNRNAAEPAQEPAPAKDKTRIRKIRPAPKKGYGLFGIPHILATGIWLVIILLVGLTLGHTLWTGITDLMAFGKPDKQITIIISESDVQVQADGSKKVDIDAIANKLYDAGLIKSPTWFKLFADTLTDKAYDIEPGTYTLNTKFDYNAMINNMQSYATARAEVEILIPEGYTCAQIFALLEEKGVCSVSDLEAYMVQVGRDGMDGEYAFSGYWFLEGAPKAEKYWMEGYLFPDTYRFYLDDEPENVVKKFLDGFDFRFTDVMKEKLDTIEERTGLDIGIREVVIIASMLEKETANDDESYTISSVIFNRLNDSANNPYLNIDATIIYALNGNIDPETGLTKPLTEADMKLDHPYNTYNHRGLPPGAISNPGRNSLDAALTPEDTDYFYYVFNPHEDEHIFSKTYDEHEDAVAYVKSLG